MSKLFIQYMYIKSIKRSVVTRALLPKIVQITGIGHHILFDPFLPPCVSRINYLSLQFDTQYQLVADSPTLETTHTHEMLVAICSRARVQTFMVLKLRRSVGDSAEWRFIQPQAEPGPGGSCHSTSCAPVLAAPFYDPFHLLLSSSSSSSSRRSGSCNARTQRQAAAK